MKIIRLSGLPVQIENLEAYQRAWEVGFDAAKDAHGNDMLSLQKTLQQLEDDLLKQYKCVEEVELPKSKKAFMVLIKQYQAPIMVAQSSENIKELVLVIIDKPII